MPCPATARVVIVEDTGAADSSHLVAVGAEGREGTPSPSEGLPIFNCT
jgi:hypothetical protein